MPVWNDAYDCMPEESRTREMAVDFFSQELVIQYLLNLGYRTGDKIWFRCIAPKGMTIEEKLERPGFAWIPNKGKENEGEPRQNAPKLELTFDEENGGKITPLTHYSKEINYWKDGLEVLRTFNEWGWGIYALPNSGGNKDSEVNNCPALFYECDGISKKEQWKKIDYLREKGFNPTQVIQTKNSLHCYYRTEETQVDGWRNLQERLIQLQNSDPAIKNKSRPMRVPGFKYLTWADKKLIPFPVTIEENNPECIYSRTQFDKVLPLREVVKSPKNGDATKKNNQKKSGEYIAMSGNLNSSSILNFCHYFDGYGQSYNHWMKARCPHHMGDSDNSFVVNPENGAFHCFGGCDTKDVWRSGLKLAKERGYIPAKNVSDKPPEKNDKLFKKDKEKWLKEYKKDCRERAKFKFTRKADISVNSGYLPQKTLTDIPSGIVGLKGGCSIGKSHLIAKWLKEDWNGEIIQIGHLNSLLENTSQRFDLMHHTEAKDLKVLGIYPKISVTDVSLGALMSIQNYINSSFVLVLDEVEQVLESYTHNQNLKKIRLQYRNKLEWLIKNAAYVIASDADLSDVTLDYLEKVRGDGKKSFIIHHTGKPGEGRKPINVTSNKGYILDEIYKAIKNGEKVIFPCETKGDLKVIESKTKNLEHELQPLFIHGDSSVNTAEAKVVKENIRNIDKVYLEYKSLGYTSSLGTGVDLSTEHYEKKYGLFEGIVLGATDHNQRLWRYRPDVPTEIYISDRVIPKQIDPEQIIFNLKIKLKKSSALLADSTNAYIEKGYYVPPSGEILEEDLPFIKLWAIHESRRNASLGNPYECLIDRLKDSGFTVEEFEPVENEEEEIEFKKIVKDHTNRKETLKKEEDIFTAKAEILDDNQYEKFKQQSGNLTLEERRKKDKTYLHKTLGIEITDEIVELERKNNFTSAVKSLNMLLADEDTATAFELRDIENSPVVTDRGHRLAKRKLLQDLKIPDFLKLLQQDGYSYSAETLEVKQIAEAARKESAEVKRYLGWSINFEKNENGNYKQSDVVVLNVILSNLGIATKGSQKRGKIRIYSLDRAKWDRLMKILDHMGKNNPKISNFIATPIVFSKPENPEPLHSNDSSLASPPSYIYIKNDGGDAERKAHSLGVPAVADFEKPEISEKTIAEKLGDAAAALDVLLDGNSATWEQVKVVLAGFDYIDMEGRVTVASMAKLKALVPAKEQLISF